MPPAALAAATLVAVVQALVTLDRAPDPSTIPWLLAGVSVVTLCTTAVARGPNSRLAGVGAGLATAAAAVAAWFGLGGLAAVGGWRWSWVWTPLALAVVPGAVAWVAFVPFVRGRRWAAAVTAAAGSAVAVLALVVTPPLHGRVAEELDTVDIPADWVLFDEREDGTPWCFFSACPAVERRYRVPAGADGERVLRRRLDDAGFEPHPSGDLVRERVRVTIRTEGDGTVALLGEAP